MSERERRSALATLCAEALERRKERKRDKTAKKCAVRNFVTLNLNIIKLKFLWM